MKTSITDIIKTTNTIVCMSGLVIKYAKCRHTGKFIKHSIAIAEMEQQNLSFKENESNTYAKINLSIVFVSLFVAVLFSMNVEMIDVVLSTLSVIGFLSFAIVLTNKKEDVVLC